MAQQRSAAPRAHRNVLVLQGGGALGAYQAGVYEAVSRAGFEPDWIAGISIGAVNAALIAGNPPERRVERLEEFWRLVTSGPQVDPAMLALANLSGSAHVNAASAMVFGVPGFFKPRNPPPQLRPPGAPEAISWYDTSPLRETLERLVDFDRLNDGGMRLSVGAVDIETGNFAYFENVGGARIMPEHIMASGALPPGLPPVHIDGAWYWDGGLVSNTPLDFVLETETRADLAVMQVDLFPARGPLPKTLSEAHDREMDIRFSSRTRLNTDRPREIRELKRLARAFIEALPDEVVQSEAAQRLAAAACDNAVTVVQLIYRGRLQERCHRDFDFARAVMLHHWRSGAAAARHALANPHTSRPPSAPGKMRVFDGPEETS